MSTETQPARDIYEAISIIQGKLPVIEKSAKNPFFGSTYTPLEDVTKKIFPMLRELGVVCLQPILETDQDNSIKVKTILRHIETGSEVESVCQMPVDSPNSKTSGKKVLNSQQAYGSTISYARRYSLTAILGIACGHEDDDGNSASQGDDQQQPGPSAGPDESQQELGRFKEWLKGMAPTREDGEALCAWLAVDAVPGLTLNAAISQVHVARSMGRAIADITKTQGIDPEIMMANARDYYSRHKE